MKIKFDTSSAVQADACALFFVKKAILFSPVLSDEGEEQAATVLAGMEKGPFDDLEFMEIDGQPTVFVNAAKERGISSLDHLRMAGYRLGTFAQKRKLRSVGLMLADAADEQFKAILHGLLYSEYSFDMYKSKPAEKFEVTYMVAAMEKAVDFKQIVEVVEIEQEAVTLAKDLVNTPGSDMPPEEFVNVAKNIAKEAGLSIKVRDVDALEKEGFNGLLTVGKGSQFAPYMVTMTYAPKNAVKDHHLAIVGKGLTFDTGGISLKPAKTMWEMKSDMSGAADALAAIYAIAKLRLPIRVTAVMCLAENRIGPGAVLPGDIFKAKNGKTVMIENTDAEGRLVLSDGLAEAGLAGATHIIDLATLTGAMVRALGYAVTGFFSNDTEFSSLVLRSGAENCEKFWPMPLEEEYADALKDKVADLCNTSPEAGAISAALFLKEFVPENTKWAHWDIAGTAFVTKPWKYTKSGATGFGIQTLIAVADKLGEVQ
jgi:leucyl aminopeptidase